MNYLYTKIFHQVQSYQRVLYIVYPFTKSLCFTHEMNNVCFLISDYCT
jgi:hypothetical protein